MTGITRRAAMLGTTAALAAPAIIARAADTIRIGVTSPETGAAAESGQYMRDGINLAVAAVNAKGGVLGRQIETIVADDQTTNPGAVLAFSKLASDPSMVAFIGSIRSTQVQAMAPSVLKTAKPMMIGGTDPKLTHQGNRWLFRCRPNDTYSAKTIASYGVHTLGHKKIALIASTDAFGTGGRDALTAELKALGITPVLTIGYANQQADFTPVVLRIRSSGADLITSYFTYETDLGVFARQLRQLGVRTQWLGSPSIVDTAALELAGPALYGTYGVADYAVDASPESKAYAADFQKHFGKVPDNQSSWAFDAINILAIAIGNAKSTDPEAVRTAILSVQGYKGAEGEYDFDQNGDGLHGYSVVQNQAGKINFIKYVEFPKPS
ncbi:MAG TPA: ABC transporter substrate-binding protein [Acetobacteraceae bacterium]|nr:ABC transporter substrate-binding protein [Acetobacteraceae bacterium]